MTKRRTTSTSSDGLPPTEQVIASIDPLPSDPNTRRVRVGRRTVARLPAPTIEALGLRIGQRWTLRLAERVDGAAAELAAHREAMRLLSRSAMSSSRLGERLTARGHAAPLVRRVLETLLEQGWLDDAAFADSVAASARRRGPIAPSVLAARLRERGVAPKVAQAAAERHGVSGTDEAAALVQKLLPRQRGTPLQIARRLAATLARRGFDDGTIAAALRRSDLPVDSDG
ncbi:MAG: regulatory protein RecX [Phycisphaerales bacterium]|nr:regulatory protein RecX [Phycisphaerales bacterium]